MKENQLKTKKYRKFLDSALKDGEINEIEKEILEAIFRKNIGVMMKIQ